MEGGLGISDIHREGETRKETENFPPDRLMAPRRRNRNRRVEESINRPLGVLSPTVALGLAITVMGALKGELRRKLK